MSSELLSHSPYNLSSLGMPMTPLLGCIALSTAVLVGLLLGISKPTLLKQWAIPRALRINGSFIWFRFCSATRSKLLSILWAWTASFLLVVYASFLQSSVVVPETQPAELSFDEMVHQNYTFLSADYKFIQISGGLASETLHQLNDRMRGSLSAAFLRKEVSLGVHIQAGFGNRSELGS